MGTATDVVARPWWERLSTHLRAYAFTWATVSTALLLVWLVPQFHNLLFHLPANVGAGERHYVWMWGLGSWLLVLGYAWSSRWVVAPAREVGWGRGVWATLLGVALLLGVPRWIPGWAEQMQDLTGAFPVPPDLLLLLGAAVLVPSPFAGPWMQRVAPAVAIVALALVATTHFVLGHGRAALLLLLLASLWLAIWKQRWPIPARVLALVRLVLMWLTLFVAVGETLWILPSHLPAWFSHEAYAVWAIYHGVFTVVAVARTVDEVAGATPRFITRLAAILLLVGAAVLFLRPVTVGRQVAARTAATLSARWFDAMEARLAALPEEGPAVFVAASGGGSRAAMFTAMVYETLHNPDAAVVGDDLRTALAALRDRIVAISSVSGGSLATAWYLRQQSATAVPARIDRWVQSIPSEVEAWTKRYASHIDPTATAGMPEDLVARIQERLAAPLPDWLRHSRFVDEMARSFMAALLRGIFTPGRERGEATSTYWEQHFGWDGITNTSGIVAADGRTLPLLLLDTTDVDAGRRLVLGYPSLPPTLLSGTTAAELSDVDPACELTLAEGVRLSANFPWGFCIPYLAVADGGREVCCTDGGVVDNTGIDSVVALLDGLHRHADPAGTDTPLTVRARGVLATLRRRGVLLVVVDSGACPEGRSGLGAALPELAEPLRALSNADTASGTDRIELAVNLIAHLLEADDTAPSGGSDVLRVVCHDAGGPRVITAWALSARDKAGIVLNLHGALARGETEAKATDLSTRLALFDARRAASQAPARAKIDEIRVALRRQSALGEEAAGRAFAAPSDQARALQPAPIGTLTDRRRAWEERARTLQEDVRKVVPIRRAPK